MVAFILPGNSASTGYEVEQSTMLESNAYYSRSASGGSQRTFTLSFWVKRTMLNTGHHQYVYSAYQDANNRISIAFLSTNTFVVFAQDSSGTQLYLQTNRLFRDPSAWMNIVVAVDTTQLTASNRVKLYVNGTQETSFQNETYPNQNEDLISNTNIYIGAYTTSTNFFCGYLAEYVYIDGSALDPTSFGEFDSDSPSIWKPIDVSGLTFGTTGFYLDFATRATDPIDASGNGNNFSSSNVLSTDHATDTCTNNFATLNPIDKGYTGTITLSEGNLVTESSSGAGDYGLRSTLGVSQGKWYLEAKMATYNTLVIGDIDARLQINMNDGSPADDFYGVQRYDNTKTNIYNDGTFVQFNTAMWGGFTSSDIISIAFDLDNGKIFFAKNGSFKDTSGNTGDPANGTNPTFTISDTTKTYTFYTELRGNDDDGTLVNFGGNPPFSISSGNSDANGHGNFEYSVPSGFLALCTKNIAENG